MQSRADEKFLSLRQALALGLCVAVPLPVFAGSGLAVPLPTVVYRLAATAAEQTESVLHARTLDAAEGAVVHVGTVRLTEAERATKTAALVVTAPNHTPTAPLEAPEVRLASTDNAPEPHAGPPAAKNPESPVESPPSPPVEPAPPAPAEPTVSLASNEPEDAPAEAAGSEKPNAARREAKRETQEEKKGAKQSERRAKQEAKEEERRAAKEQAEEKRAREEEKRAEEQAQEEEKRAKEQAKEDEKRAKEEEKRAKEQAKEDEKRAKDEEKEEKKKDHSDSESDDS